VQDVTGEIIRLENIPIDPNEINNDLIGLHGHSRGAAIAILAARYQKAIRAVTAWSPVSHFERFTERQRIEWREKGYQEILNSRTGQIMRLNVTLLDNMEHNRESFNIPLAANALTLQEKGLLIIAGREDMTAKPEESEAIYNASKKEFSELHIIPQTGHTFGTEHPYKGSTPALDMVLIYTINFFQKYLIQHPIPAPE
jgi:dipeptidyl aminopeptidase/acylaminoacyl peptidase